MIATNSSYASEPPANFHLVASDRLYQLWRRVGSTPPFETIEPPGAPGAVLDCRSQTERRLAASSGVASLMAQPLLFPGVQLAPGDVANVPLALPAGRWELSIAYTSTVTMGFAAQGKALHRCPPTSGAQAPYFNVGSVTGSGVDIADLLANQRRPAVRSQRRYGLRRYRDDRRHSDSGRPPPRATATSLRQGYRRLVPPDSDRAATSRPVL